MKKLIFCIFVILLFQACTNNNIISEGFKIQKNKNLIIFKHDSPYISKFELATIEHYITKKSSCSFILDNNTNINVKELPVSEIDTVYENYKEKDLFSIIFNRTSVRYFKDGADIPAAEIELILRAAMSIPTGWDKRALSFVVVKDKEMIYELFQPTIIEEHRNKDEYIGGKVVFVICGDPNISPAYYLDATLASLNIMYASEYLNYGSCWSDIVPVQKRINLVRKKLKIPKSIVPYNMVVVGYRDQEKKPRNKFDLNKIHTEFWGNPKKTNIGKNKFLNLN